jgi:hypothetical protein
MKIYQHTPNKYIRLQIAKLGEETQYITLHETDREEVESMIKEIITKQNLSPFQTGNRTQIMVREATGGENGKCKSLSFRGLSTKQVLDLIVNHINKLNNEH